MQMAAFLARQGDGELEERELLELRTTALSLASQAGVHAEAAMEDAAAAIAEHMTLSVDDATAAFLDDARALQPVPEDVRRAFYRELLQIASSDRSVEGGERLILDEVKRLWQL